ncbi:NAD-dependent epimerase/dehydratase family protein [Lutimonas saemankumensis]|uniref:NAD-dependent epimerase/dehydratase family protein n=1 Tax=Lutimonas saemankumensis TaxID=483016 RepID=UPI001CD36205|nr:aldehyde reductase [Lutimonas saemankumensis]MCA0931750.1 NAD-dependent epimerase/dehydratase family protein [Lutimonas saemankumensis]
MKEVLITGVSGYVGQHCAVELLNQGYAVRGSVRSLSKTDKITDDIAKVIDPKGKLGYCELNLLEDEGWEEAMQGCDYVLHVASPFVTSQPKDENDLIRPAVEGTQRALKAAKNAGIKRMVLTSSMVAMIGGSKGVVDINPNSWTDVNAKGVSAYLKSKTLAEKSAWDFIKNQTRENLLELVTVHPGPVYGPTLSGNLTGESMNTYKELITGGMPRLPQAAINMSDVRDVAKIHVAALENKAANGQRFIVSTEKAYSFQQMAQILKSNGYDKVSTKVAPNFLLRFLANFNADLKGMLPYIGNTFNGDISATMDTFDWKPLPIEKTVLDTAKSVQEALQG